MEAARLYHSLKQDNSDLLASYDIDKLDSFQIADRRAALAKISDRLAIAHKFEARWQGLLDDATLHQTAVKFFRAGVLRMPFEHTYFEFTHAFENEPHKRLGFVVHDKGPYNIEGDVFLFNGESWVDLAVRAQTHALMMPPERAVFEYPPEIQENQDSRAGLNSLRAMQYSITLCLLLSTKHFDLSTSRGAREAVNAKRLADGRPPIFEYHTVRLKNFEKARAELGGTHASPKLHWRRGHLRTLPDGRQVPVNPCLVGLIEKGLVVKDYLVAPEEKR